MSDLLHVGTRKGLFSLRRLASGWKIEATDFMGDEVPLLLHDRRDRALYAALNLGHFGGKMHRRDAGGAFEEVGVPTYPEKGADEVDVNEVSREDVPWKLKLVWELSEGGDDRPGELWCGTIPGGLFRSKDRGASWELVRSLWDHPGRRSWFGGGADQPGIHSVLVDPRDSRRLVVGVSCGGVWVSDDDAETWRCDGAGMRAAYMPEEKAFDPVSQDPHRIVLCAADPDVLWTQHHNGIFRSTDGAKSWTEITNATPSTFGFGVAVHPQDANTAWFVPAQKDEHRIPVGGKLVVNRTRDGGETFETLTRGLPQEHAYDLIYRHALDVCSEGERLAFGSTTGGLFLSEDQGDSWTEVSAHLPPILCVRFGIDD